MKIAIVGSGISGLAAAHRLGAQAQLTLFEAQHYFGGHTHTVDVSLPDAQGHTVTHGVDTGFLVFNERTYPQLIALLEELGVPSAKSDMSFSVQLPGTLEWSGSSLNTVFSQRRNLLNPRFWRMLRDVLRFNHLASTLAAQLDAPGAEAALQQPLSTFLDQHHLSDEFRHWYFLPMLGCIWSCPTDQMLQFPVATMLRFCHNHGLLQVRNRPQWWTVAGGARQYVEKIVARIADKRLNAPVEHIQRDTQGVWLRSQGQTERFDAVVLATHADQSLALLGDASAAEHEVLGGIRYQANRAVLHTDTAVLPRAQRAWAAWNYERGVNEHATHAHASTEPRVCLHYLLNQLQPLPFAQRVVVSLNPLRPIASERVLGRYDYAHPVFDLRAIQAQRQMPALQGLRNTYFCGAWTGYGFHEDGLKSGIAAAEQLLHTQAINASSPRGSTA